MCPPQFILITGEAKYEGELEINPEYEQWIINDQLLMGWLYRSMIEGVATEVMGSTTVAGLWQALESLYGAYSKSKMEKTRTLIQTVRNGTTPMVEYLQQKKNWSDVLALARDPYPEVHLVANDILLSFDIKIERLQTLNTSNKSTRPSSPQANVAAKRNSRGNFASCGRDTHQYIGNGGRFSRNRGSTRRFRGRGRANTSRPSCQVCGKYVHSAVVCYNRFDENFMGSDPNNANTRSKTTQTNHNAFVASPEVLESDAWFADSGASNHITSDAAVLNQKQSYGGQGNRESGASRSA
uniref:Uncharacterized protein n=1 Tax=Cannabis sativa TaxID=3483 RepID=A0A803QE43_CANSA